MASLFENIEKEELEQKIKLAKKAYYEDSKPIIPDEEYDELIKKYIELGGVESVGYSPNTIFSEVNHNPPMLSLEKAYTISEVSDFIEKAKKFLTLAPETKVDLVVEEKIDGLSLSLLYKNGKLIRASTRGDGKVGEDVTQNVLVINSIPKHLVGNAPESIEIRGEVYMKKSDFHIINQQQKANGEKEFVSARNCASGTLRQLDSKITASRPLNFWAWGIGECSKNLGNSFYEILLYLETLGFPKNPSLWLGSNILEIEKRFEQAVINRQTQDYDIDGMVYKINNIEWQNRLGNVSNAPRWAVAHKFNAVSSKTTLEKINIQVGRTGVITPVAELTPVQVGDVMVSRASLHNNDEISRKDIREGDKVIVSRAGDVIPYIDSVVLEERGANIKPFIFPTKCPSCDSILIRNENEVAWKCVNKLCKAQNLERLKYAVSKNALDIKGFGERTIEIFMEKGFIKNIVDIFKLEKYADEIKEMEGFGELSVKNMITSINEKKIVKLDKFIVSLGISQVGETMANLLSEHFKTWDNTYKSLTNNDFYKELENINGIGQSVSADIKDYFTNKDNQEILIELTKIIKIEDNNKKIIETALTGKTLVFTGTLKISRQEAKDIAKRSGANVSSSISSKTDYLVVGEDSGSKAKKALELGVKTISEEEFLNMVKN